MLAELPANSKFPSVRVEGFPNTARPHLHRAKTIGKALLCLIVLNGGYCLIAATVFDDASCRKAVDIIELCQRLNRYQECHVAASEAGQSAGENFNLTQAGHLVDKHKQRFLIASHCAILVRPAHKAGY